MGPQHASDTASSDVPQGPTHRTPVAIIGAGPVGLFAGFALGMQDINATVVDVLPQPGGQCAELYPEKPIYDIPGLPVCTGAQLTENLLAQIRPFGPQFLMDRQVLSVSPAPNDGFVLRCNRSPPVETRAVVLATGAGVFSPKKLPFPDAPAFENRSWFYAVRDPHNLVHDKRVVVLGGGDSALDWANVFADHARSVTLVHRRPTFRAAPQSVARFRRRQDDGRVRVLVGILHRLHGDTDTGMLHRITIMPTAEPPPEQGPISIDADLVFAFYGMTMRPSALHGPPLNLRTLGPLVEVDTEEFSTSHPGVFAIGDANTYPGKLKLILCGFHEASLMARGVFRRFNPGQKPRLEYTTTSRKFKEKLDKIASPGSS